MITSVAPVLLVADIVKSADYWRKCLGFEVELYNDPPSFAICRRDDARIMLAQAGDMSGHLPNWKIVDKTWNAYFWVDDADALYNEFIANGANIDYTIYNAPYGCREFGIQDLDEHDIAFGQVLAR